MWPTSQKPQDRKPTDIEFFGESKNIFGPVKEGAILLKLE
jgi:hypothetical protein